MVKLYISRRSVVRLHCLSSFCSLNLGIHFVPGDRGAASDRYPGVQGAQGGHNLCPRCPSAAAFYNNK